MALIGSPDVFSRVTDIHDNMFAKFNNRRYKASKIKYDTEILSGNEKLWKFFTVRKVLPKNRLLHIEFVKKSCLGNLSV